MLDPVERKAVPQYISLIDVALVPLRKLDTFTTVIPSKIFENAAMGKPILLGVEGEAQEIVESYDAGLCFEPENEADFLANLAQLHGDAALYKRVQKGGLKLAQDFNREVLAAELLEIVAKVAGKPLPVRKEQRNEMVAG